MDDERLTEAEWRQRDAQRECSTHGHNWSVISTMRGPVALVCASQCGHPGYAVVPRVTPHEGPS